MSAPGIVVIIHKAIDRERDAVSTYLRLAKAVKDVKAKNVLINLATDEVGHLTKLETHLSSQLKGGHWVISKAEGEAIAAAIVPEDSLVNVRLSDLAAADEVRILELAVDREIAANRFYLDMARDAETPEGREMFLSLAKEEDLHRRILRAEIDSIGKNGFWFDMQEFTMEQEP